MIAVLDSNAIPPERKRQKLEAMTAKASALMKRVVQELEGESK